MKTNAGPRFSVVIPCYNEEDFIGKTLLSLKQQVTSASYEIIVVDNNCNDATASIARHHGATVITEKRPGICAARQAGTEAARGEIIISTDADTTFSKDWLDNIDKEFRRNPGIVAVGGPCMFKDTPWWGKYTIILFGASYIYSLIFGHPFYITATNTAFKKSAWTGYDPLLMQGGDEVGLLHQLRHYGKFRFSLGNPVYTSARRLQRGILYNFFVTFLFYYLTGYIVNSIFGRQIIGTPPAFRGSYRDKLLPGMSLGLATILTVTLAFSLVSPRITNFFTDNITDAYGIVYRLL